MFEKVSMWFSELFEDWIVSHGDTPLVGDV